MSETRDSFTLYDGSKMTVLERPAEPDDKLVMRFEMVQDCGAPPPHTHPGAVEIFEVEEGDFEMQLEGEWRAVSAGESLTVQPGQVHTFRNETPGTVVIRNTHDPHHDFEAYIREVAELSHEIESTSPNSPKAMARMAMIWDHYDHLIEPGPAPIKVVFALSRRVGSLLGVKRRPAGG